MLGKVTIVPSVQCLATFLDSLLWSPQMLSK